VREYEGLSEDNWHTMFSPALTGDGLVMAAEIGAKVHTLPVNMNTFLGFRTPPKTAGGPPGFQTGNVGMVTFPHTLVVNRHGKRFGDESYFQDIVAASRRFDVWRHDYPNLPSFAIFDTNFREKYTFAGAPPGSPIPDWVACGETIGELATKLGIDPIALEATLAEFNEHARFGKDPVFHRGEAAWARMFTGDLTSTTNPNLGPVDRAPFYGLRLVLSGGASAGLMTDPAARVLHVRGNPIPGLYASGNASACTDFGAGYQAGESLARGMVFSYLAVRHMAERGT
jgi:3-oxosteroid 1-dehydrogenase